MTKTLLATALLVALGVAHADNAASPDQAAGKGADKVARGLLLQHQDRLIFSPCRDRSYTNVDDASAGGEVTAALRQFGLGDGKPLYIEVFGAAESGLLRIDGLNMAKRDARCYAPRRSTGEWRAGAGNAWALTLFEGGATLQRSGQEDLTGSYEETLSTPTQAEIRITGASTVNVRLNRRSCRDNSTGDERLYAWHAEVTTATGKLEGCAWRQ